MDFNQFGINYVIDQTPESWTGVRDITRDDITIDIDENINANSRRQPHGGRHIDMLTENVATLRVRYQNGPPDDFRIIQQCGQGSYGTVYRIIKNGVIYALKRQTVDLQHPINPVIKEAIINIILNQTNQVPNIYLIGKSRNYVYMITECMRRDISTLIKESLNKENYTKIFLMRILPIIRNLSHLGNNTYMYNHGDFHSGNIMMNENNEIRIIDFGYSRIQHRSGNFLQTNNYNTRYSESRDTTRLVYDLRYWRLREMYRQLTPAFRRFINNTLCLECNLTGEIHDHRGCFELLGPTVRDPILRDEHHGISYKWFNRHNNTHGNFTEMLASLIATSPSPSPAPSPVPSPVPVVPSPVPVVPVSRNQNSQMNLSQTPMNVTQINVTPMNVTPNMARLGSIGGTLNTFNNSRYENFSNVLKSKKFNSAYINPTTNDTNLSEILKSNKGSISVFIYALHTVDNFWTFMQTFTMEKSYISGGKNVNTRKHNRHSPKSYKSARSSKTAKHSKVHIKNAIIDDYEHYSVIYLYHYIRFNAFPRIKNEDKMKLFIDAANVPLRNIDVFNEIVEANDFQTMKSIIKKHNDIKEIIGESVPYKKIWKIIMKAYFKEDDAIRSFNLLQYLLYLRPHDGGDIIKILNDFINSYMKSDDRDFEIPKQSMELITI